MKLISYISSSPDAPFIVKPDTVMLRNNDPYYIPAFTGSVSAKFHIAAKITRVTKAIDVRFAGRCYEEIGTAVEIVAADVLEKCRKEGLPWDRAVSYDKSTAVPNIFCGIPEKNVIFDFKIDGETVLKKKIGNMAEILDAAVSAASFYVTLKIGDMVLIPLSDEVFSVNIGDSISADCGDSRLLDFEIK